MIAPVKVGIDDTFKIEARSGADGTLKWDYLSDYNLPLHNWVTSFAPVITPGPTTPTQRRSQPWEGAMRLPPRSSVTEAGCAAACRLLRIAMRRTLGRSLRSGCRQASLDRHSRLRA